MPELRKDIVTREWVIIATERAKRPSDFSHAEEAAVVKTKNHSTCPFCPGNEHLTPSEIIAYRSAGSKADTPGWWVRVIPNKFGALRIEGDLRPQWHQIYERMEGVGAHEVVIETPEHGKSLGRMEVTQVKEVLWAYRDRYLDLLKDARLKYVMIFRNHGKVAGASIDHAHSQIIATPMIPQKAWVKIKGVEQYREYREKCAYCEIVTAELSAGERIVAANGSFVAIEPYAARFPFETWVIPRRHSPQFTTCSVQEMADFAAILKETLLRIDLCLDDPPYNYTLLSTDFSDNFHWHVDIIPRLTIAAGFELGTGIYINVVAPEQAAQYFREVKI